MGCIYFFFEKHVFVVHPNPQCSWPVTKQKIMENYLANFIPLLCYDTLWYALLSWPSCSSISELHCSVARLSGSRSILNWSLTPPFQSTLILFGKIVQSRTSSSWSCSKMWDIDFVHNVLIVSRIFGLGMPSYFDQCKRIHNDPRMRQLKVEWKERVRSLDMTKPISDQFATEPGHGRVRHRGEEIYRETEIRWAESWPS